MISDRAILPGGLRRRGPRARTAASGPRRIAMALTAPVPESGQAVVVELDPYEGEVTALVRELLGGRGRHLAVEPDPVRAARLSLCFPDVEVVTADAASLPGVLAGRGIAVADVVIAGRSWAGLPHAERRASLAAVREVLSPEGAFTAPGPLYARFRAEERHFRRMLGVSFEEVVAGRTAWDCLPPAFVHHCRRPRVLAPLASSP
ncbi:ribose ABC transporter ATP-binding protein [Streptomyces clavuligerus]|uniref:ribose ABC transporter ATP-binding protein n=1 Tax=Streptomyces clavuligerus TaxID=1901 RepID=UPI00018515CA|nr:ribose ABC transporter ATP-binding protein [Streptomyces clavuligerus]MBY6307533.1 ribose ABC transporter ATP-binding protein [Streptomyces clavuligerus]QCS09911.1 ribose ABC transporter ATP-binding protein [Streptomyces clavuligerus]QPJ98043.1 ribose ABC transporter ATP-binding protein [Streptomyces clavuligerus]WDN56617.1 ribose ABC transporter ATP-binding protein [Streptomyces clavuligerus]